jgi:hypothetical protein
MALGMNALQPPPLPDVPFAVPFAALAPVAQVSYPAAPVGRAARAFMAVPLPLAMISAVAFLLKQYASGADFRHDKNHYVIWFFDVVLLIAFCAVPLATGGIIFLCTWGRLEPRGRVRAAACTVLAVALLGLALRYSHAVFRFGKARAYAGVNATLLTADCAAVAAALPGPPNPRGSAHIDPKDPSVPPYLRSLRPDLVRVTAADVRVIMAHDAISGAYTEGFVVPRAPLNTSPKAYAAQNRISIVSLQPPVFRFPAE